VVTGNEDDHGRGGDGFQVFPRKQTESLNTGGRNERSPRADLAKEAFDLSSTHRGELIH